MHTQRPFSMARLLTLVVAFGTAALTGCATHIQPTVQLTAEKLNAQDNSIGIVTAALPTADTYFPGADCLLCIAVARSWHSSMTSHVRSLARDDLENIKGELAEAFERKGMRVKVIDEPIALNDLPKFSRKEINFALRDFTSLKSKYQVQKLLVVHVQTIGVSRQYSGYVPTNPPLGFFNGLGYIVDLDTNRYDWYSEMSISNGSQGEWDEPPAYPGLTNAYFQSLAMGRERILAPFVD